MSSSALFATQRFCWFWKTLSPWVLHPKKQTFHQLSSTSSFNVCSQFASIVLPFSRMLMRKNVHSGIHIDIWDRYFGVIWIRISDSRSLKSCCIKGTHESTLVMDSSVPLLNYDTSDIGSLIMIQVTPKGCSQMSVCMMPLCGRSPYMEHVPM